MIPVLFFYPRKALLWVLQSKSEKKKVVEEPVQLQVQVTEAIVHLLALTLREWRKELLETTHGSLEMSWTALLPGFDVDISFTLDSTTAKSLSMLSYDKAELTGKRLSRYLAGTGTVSVLYAHLNTDFPLSTETSPPSN